MLDSWDISIVRWNRIILMVILAAMSVLVFTNVVGRFLLGDSIAWAGEISRHLMIWLTFLGSGLVLRYGGHIAVDNLQDMLPSVAAQVLRLGIVLVLLMFFGTMIFLGSYYVVFQWEQTTPVTQVPFGFVYSAMPIGFLLMIYHLSRVARLWISKRKLEVQENVDASTSIAL